MFRAAVWSAVRNRKIPVNSVRMRSAHKIYGRFAPKKYIKKERGEQEREKIKRELKRNCGEIW